MALHLITGASGSGKTCQAYDLLLKAAAANPKQNFLVIVPEQYTMQATKELVDMHSGHSVMNIDVLSFQRLAYRIFGELGGNLNPLLDDMGKSLVLEKIALSNRKKLVYLGDNLKKPGYIDEMKSMLSELQQYQVDSDGIDRLLSLADERSLLHAKLTDIQRIYRSFEEYLKDRYVTPEEILDILCRVCEKSEILKNSTLLFDGFTGFTPVQNQLLGKLMKICRDIWVTITINESNLDFRKNQEHELFHMSQVMAGALRQMAEEMQVDILPGIHCGEAKKKRFLDCPALAYLEEHIFRRDGKVYPEPCKEIRIYKGTNPAGEMAWIAGEIHRLLRTKECRYRDIAVVTGDMESYESYVRQAFERENIPCFLDRKQSVFMNPMVEYIRAALDMIISGFGYESVFRFLKTGMSSISREDINLLENYTLAFGIRSWKRWSQEFQLNDRRKSWNLEEINRIRGEFLGEIGDFVDNFRAGKSVLEKTQALYELLLGSEIQKKIKRLQDEFEKKGEASKAREYAQIYGTIMNLFDKLVEVLGDEKIGMRDYQQLLETGFQKIKVGIIPPTVDQVLVGDVERTRLPKIKYLFFAGVNEGLVPKLQSNGGILTEDEREMLASHNVELAPTARENMSRQKFYLYLNLTKPSQGLYLSYASGKADGSTALPSFLISGIRRMFPDISMEEEGCGREAYLELETEKQGEDLLLVGFQEAVTGEISDSWTELFSWYGEDKEREKQLSGFLKAAFLEKPKDHIGRLVARTLYGKVLENSVTRLERFSACAFAHFLQYGLRLQEREVYEFRPADLGNVLHSSLEYFSKIMDREGKSWNELGEDDLEKLVVACLRHSLEKPGYEVLSDTARNQYMYQRMKRFLKRSIRVLAQQIGKGDFRPEKFEISFGEANMQEMPIDGDGKMRLQGRIDRIDMFQSENETLVRVIDYKTGNKTLELNEVYYGLSLQLLIYLKAAMNSMENEYPDKEVRPAGIFYYKIDDPLVKADWDTDGDDIEPMLMRELRMKGLANSDPDILEHMDHTVGVNGEKESLVFPYSIKKDGSPSSRSQIVDKKKLQLLTEFAMKNAQEIGSSILAGEAELNPYQLRKMTACTYCAYRSVCGFDQRIPGYEFRKLKILDDRELWEKMKERCEDGSDLD